MDVFLGVDVGTSSTKGVLVSSEGDLVASTVREHSVMRSRDGRVEMDGAIWWNEFCEIAEELTTNHSPTAVGVSGMGPCLLLTDKQGVPVAPAALYGVDTRATSQIDSINAEFGADVIFESTDSYLSTQSAGPKFRWFEENDSDRFERAHRFFMPASYLVWNLTGEYTLDRQSASQTTPLFDAETQEWHDQRWQVIAKHIEAPRLGWAGEIAGHTKEKLFGIERNTPVIFGSIDAWTEAQSVGATRPGDLMLMYGTTMFLIATSSERVRHPAMWGTTGLASDQRNLAGGMATSGAITGWIRELTGQASYDDLTQEAEASGLGANGLVMLPYFAGERTPIQDPHARGVILGLTLNHNRGDLYRAGLEATACGVRHNIEAFTEAGLDTRRIIAVGGGAQNLLWPQIVTDVTGLTQLIPKKTIGASYGAAFLAAQSQALSLSIEDWNQIETQCTPENTDFYDELYHDYRQLHEATVDLQHRSAKRGI